MPLGLAPRASVTHQLPNRCNVGANLRASVKLLPAACLLLDCGSLRSPLLQLVIIADLRGLTVGRDRHLGYADYLSVALINLHKRVPVYHLHGHARDARIALHR